MDQTPNEVHITNLAFFIFWLMIVIVILAVGKQWQRSRIFREKMLVNWRSSLGIATVFIVGMGLSGSGLFNLHGITIF
jgi:hypothetical protein